MKKYIVLVITLFIVASSSCFAKNNQLMEEDVQYIYDVSTRIHI